MKKALALGFALTIICGCGGSTKLAPDVARQQVSQLTTLYKENREKFILQKQELEQARDCGRSESLVVAADELIKEAAMSPESNDTLTVVKMELDQADKTCRSK